MIKYHVPINENVQLPKKNKVRHKALIPPTAHHTNKTRDNTCNGHNHRQNVNYENSGVMALWVIFIPWVFFHIFKRCLC